MTISRDKPCEEAAPLGDDTISSWFSGREKTPGGCEGRGKVRRERSEGEGRDDDDARNANMRARRAGEGGGRLSSNLYAEIRNQDSPFIEGGVSLISQYLINRRIVS